MKVTRDELYFEPRCVDENGTIRWYGERVVHPEIGRHAMQTVYIRDGRTSLYIYRMEEDERRMESKDIKALFRLICEVPKKRKNFIYGRRCQDIR